MCDHALDDFVTCTWECEQERMDAEFGEDEFDKSEAL